MTAAGGSGERPPGGDGPSREAGPPPGDGGPAASGSPDDGGEPIGPFPTWRALYTTVLVWWAFMVVLLYVLTVVLDRGAP